MTTNTNTTQKRIAIIECPHCDNMVHAYRRSDGRIVGATTGALALGTTGALIGGSFGLVSGGAGWAATKVFGGGLAAIGGGYGYLAGSIADGFECPNCEGDLVL